MTRKVATDDTAFSFGKEKVVSVQKEKESNFVQKRDPFVAGGGRCQKYASCYAKKVQPKNSQIK